MKGEEEEEEDRGDKYVEAAAAAEEVEDSVPLDRRVPGLSYVLKKQGLRWFLDRFGRC